MHGLGRGLSSLIPNKQGADFRSKVVSVIAPFSDAEAPLVNGQPQHQDQGEAIVLVDPTTISSNPYQPRSSFEKSKLAELAESIRTQGILNPLIVTRCESGGYELIAGERRLRAALDIQLARVPVIVRSANREQKVALALIENIQREDLNPIERARGYRELIQECGLTQEMLSKTISKPRSSIANTVRLLDLPDVIRESLENGEISEGHAKVILSAPDDAARINLWKKITVNSLPVRAAESEARASFIRAHTRRASSIDPSLAAIQQKLEEKLSTKVAVTGTMNRGRVVIEYFSREELERMVGSL